MNSLYLAQWDAFIRYHQLPGEGMTLVYLPGLSFPSLANFLPVATDPKLRGRPAILVDYLGSGFSDWPETFDHSMDSHAQTVAAILDNEGLKQCAVIGHSMGGTVGIKLALQRPDLVSNLIVAEANITPGGGAATGRIASFTRREYVVDVYGADMENMRQAAIEGSEGLALFVGGLRLADPAGIYGSSMSLVELEASFKERFFNLPIPRTFIYGQKSLPENKAQIMNDAPEPEELVRHGIHIAVVPNAGHVMMVDNLAGFVDVLAAALEPTSSGEA